MDDPVQHIDDFRALNLAEVFGAIRQNGRQVICAVEDQALGELLALPEWLEPERPEIEHKLAPID